MSDDAVKIVEIPKPRMEWKVPGDLYYIVADHGRWIRFDGDNDVYCEFCNYDPREAPTCERDITEVYKNFLANMATIIPLAAIEQRGREHGARSRSV